MPHVVVLYTNNLETQTDMTALCRKLANAMLTVQDEDSKQVFPTGGVRVLAYPAAHYAIADGQRDYAFVYLNLRMGRGRSDTVKKKAGETLRAVALEHFTGLLADRYVGVTLQVDEGQEAFDAKLSSIHPLFVRN
jgi:5-carboxymethyl-2-hydroxymuconate isomerase